MHDFVQIWLNYVLLKLITSYVTIMPVYGYFEQLICIQLYLQQKKSSTEKPSKHFCLTNIHFERIVIKAICC